VVQETEVIDASGESFRVTSQATAIEFDEPAEAVQLPSIPDGTPVNIYDPAVVKGSPVDGVPREWRDGEIVEVRHTSLEPSLQRQASGVPPVSSGSWYPWLLLVCVTAGVTLVLIYTFAKRRRAA
jgi:hypothetical protein